MEDHACRVRVSAEPKDGDIRPFGRSFQHSRAIYLGNGPDPLISPPFFILFLLGLFFFEFIALDYTDRLKIKP